MKAVLLACLVALTCKVLQAANDGASDLTVDANTLDSCAPLCKFYQDICLFNWVDPKNLFSPHCDGLNDVRRAPVHCQLCLKLNGVPPQKDRTTQKPPTNSSDISASSTTCNCEGPCACVCNCYENACMPAQLDPEGYFKSHCAGLDDEKYPSPWCVLCLLKNDTLSTNECETTPITTPSTLIPPESPKTTLATITTTTNTPPAPVTTQPPVLQTTTLTTTPEALKICTRPSCSPDPCLAFCDNYSNVCVPSDSDPCFHYYPHCNIGILGYHSASEHCLNCLKVHGVCPNPNVLTSPPPTTSENPTSALLPVTTLSSNKTKCNVPSSCDKPLPSTPDPCRSFCNNYSQVCMPPEMDTCFQFYPHCVDGIEGYHLPSERCLKCVCVHGLRPKTSIPTTLPNTTPVPSRKPTVTLPWECWCSRVQTMVTEVPVKTCPAKSRDCVFTKEGDLTSEDWSCSCGTLQPAKKLSKQFFFGDGGCESCPSGSKGQCTCKRTKKITKQVKIKSCEGFDSNRRLCHVDSPSAFEQTTLSKECKCKNCQKEKVSNFLGDSYYDQYGDGDDEDDDY